jgi:protein-L-isoaspartate(D-aspartate) O-methyltransferase
MIDYAAIRRNMVDTQLRTYDVNSKRLLDAVDEVARELYLPVAKGTLAYADQPITWPEADGRTMLQPMVVARMIQAAEIQPGDKVLSVAGGTGYAAAVMAAMGAAAILLESSEAMAAEARRAAAEDGAAVEVRVGALAEGWPQGAPYDVILVEGAVEQEPAGLLGQLAEGGRLVAVVGRGRAGRVVAFQRSGDSIGRRNVFDAAAPLLPEFAAPPAFRF